MAVSISRVVEVVPPIAQPPRAGLGRLRKIALLGSHEASLKYAPWDDPSWELWGHAASYKFNKRTCDRYFDLHRRECWTKTNGKGQQYLKWLAYNQSPIYMQERYPDVPASIRYPLERITSEFRPYFTGHAAYMIALALTEGVTHIGFFGINYGPDSEYGTQRGSCEYWMGVAEARGVQLVLPKSITLLNEPAELYGYASHDEDGKLVKSYTQRVWKQQPAQAVAVDANGLEPMPAHVRAEFDRERLDTPPPAGHFAASDVVQRTVPAGLPPLPECGLVGV